MLNNIIKNYKKQYSQGYLTIHNLKIMLVNNKITKEEFEYIIS